MEWRSDELAERYPLPAPVNVTAPATAELVVEFEPADKIVSVPLEAAVASLIVGGVTPRTFTVNFPG